MSCPVFVKISEAKVVSVFVSWFFLWLGKGAIAIFGDGNALVLRRKKKMICNNRLFPYHGSVEKRNDRRSSHMAIDLLFVRGVRC